MFLKDIDSHVSCQLNSCESSKNPFKSVDMDCNVYVIDHIPMVRCNGHVFTSGYPCTLRELNGQQRIKEAIN